MRPALRRAVGVDHSSLQHLHPLPASLFRIGGEGAEVNGSRYRRSGTPQWLMPPSE